MSDELRSLIKHILTWVLYASAGLGALAYGLFLQTRRRLQTFKEKQGMIPHAVALNPLDVLEQKLYGVESLRGLAIVVMLVGFLFWPLLFLGVLLFFFQTNAWKSTQHALFALARDHPEYKLAQQKSNDALEDTIRVEQHYLEQRGKLWQRVFAITMAVALVIAICLLFITVNWFSAVSPVTS
ncbi:MAG: hypothetical protein AAB424_00975 [Patescibacteria group bacterium]